LGIAAQTAVSLTAGNKTIDGSLDIGSNTAGHDFTVYGATTNFSKMRWDASQDHLHFSDQAKIVFGTGGGPGGSDSSIQADGSNLVITNSAGNIQIGDTVEITGDLDVTGNVLPGITYVKILPSDFVPDDVGRPAMIDDTGSDRWLESHGTAKLFAYVDIPVGFKATHVDVYGSATSAVTVYEADVNSKTVTSKGTGNIGTQIDITDVNSDATNYILIELAQASGEEVYGGKLTIAKI
jgi:phage baseplate assembly protein W